MAEPAQVPFSTDRILELVLQLSPVNAKHFSDKCFFANILLRYYTFTCMSAVSLGVCLMSFSFFFLPVKVLDYDILEMSGQMKTRHFYESLQKINHMH